MAKKYTKYTLLGTVSLLVLCMSSEALVAQDDSAQETFEIEEIMVTARKRSESIKDAPVSVKAFGAQAIEDFGIRETADFIQLTSNVTLAESQSISTSFLTIRGLTQVRNGESPVAVIIDGVLQFNNRQFVQQLFDVEQIEVVKGPQGALYGRNATGGAIIITTKKPSNDTEGYVKFGYGTGDEVVVEGSYSAPIVEDELFVRMSGRMVNRTGYHDNITFNEKDDPYFDRSLRGRLIWVPDDSFSLDLNANYSKHDGRGIGFQFGVSSADDTSRPFENNNEDRGERETFGMSLKLEKDFDFALLTSVTSYDNIETLTRADQFPYTALANGVGDGAPFGDGTQSQYTDIEGWSQEVRLTSPAEDRFRWQVGAYYLSWDRFIASTTGLDTGSGVRRVTTEPFFNAATNPTQSFFADDNSNEAYAIFFQTSYDVTEGVELSFAGRYDEEKRNQFVSPLNTGGVPGAENNISFSKFSPKVSLSYAINEQMNLYGTWGEGFRSGQFNQNGTSDAALAAGIAGVGDVVGQEDSESLEFGFKGEFLDRRLQLNAAYFDTKVEGQQYFVFIGGIGAQVLINIDEVDIKGFEVEAVFRATKGLDLYASYGELDSKIKAYTTDPSFVGNVAPYTPNKTFNAGFQWRKGLSSEMNLVARLDYEHRGRQFWSPNNTFPRSALDLVNAKVAIEEADGEWSMAASVNNVTNEKYNSEFVLPAFSHKANPRVWRLEIMYRF